VTRSDLTEPQRRLLDRAAADDDGFYGCSTIADGRVSRNLEAIGLGEATAYAFWINEVGRTIAIKSDP
jgi:hypothetical protein